MMMKKKKSLARLGMVSDSNEEEVALPLTALHAQVKLMISFFELNKISPNQATCLCALAIASILDMKGESYDVFEEFLDTMKGICKEVVFSKE